MHVVIVGTYPPTRCGIATFTADVETALGFHNARVTIVPVFVSSDPGLGIRRDDRASYAQTAHRVNALGCDVVLIQHEFGIFGGVAGSYLLDFTEALTVPFAVTLHTVLAHFTAQQAYVIERLYADAAMVTVFTETARQLLLNQGLVAENHIEIVPHGAPAELYESIDLDQARAHIGLPAIGPVMSTFGLLSAGKGIELAVTALSTLVGEFPTIRYVIAGLTHPEVVRYEGERYRERLVELVDELGVKDNVVFLDRFLGITEIAALLAVTDVFCTPYRGEDQIVSGALTFALAARCPVVSTPYRYAEDVLASGAGTIVDFDDSVAFAEAIRQMLTDGPTRASATRAVAEVSTALAWVTVGETLLALLSAVSNIPARRARRPRTWDAVS